MPTYNVLEAKSNLSKLIDAVESGQESEIVLARNGKPAARIVPLQKRPIGQRIGIAKGKFKAPEDFDELNPLIERMFNGEVD